MSGNVARFHFRNRAGLCSVFATLAAISGPPVRAQGAPRPEQLIKWRQAAFQVAAWNTQRLKAALANDSGDARDVLAAANALAAIAASGIPDLFAPGTEHGKGWRETTAADAAFKDPVRFRAVSDEFAREAALLAKLATGADRAATRAQFAKVAKTCKGCHDKFRETD
jgi:cytochrome c556